jgi:hypothetical protein
LALWVLGLSILIQDFETLWLLTAPTKLSMT